MKNSYQIVGLVVVLVVLCLNLISPAGAAHAANSQYFPQTGFTVNGKFLDYWNQNGGLSVFGYPISNAQAEVDSETGIVYLTQWFERNRFELHPENAGTKYEVELGLLGKTQNRNRIANDPTFQPSAPILNYHFFPQTQHNVSSLFYEFWQNNGGLDRLGLPIDEEQQEIDPETGHPYLTQWFERARVELHTENQPPYNVELGLLGKETKQVTPVTLLNTYYKAISRNAFQQAYNLWENPQQNLGPFTEWVQTHADTLSVAVTTGTYTPIAGAGQAFAKVPTVLVTTQTDGTTLTFYGCYITHHLSQSDGLFWQFSGATIEQDVTGVASVHTLMESATRICNNITT